jgi:hypothetical protein
MKAERNSEELLKVMRRFQSYLQNDTAFFHEAEASLGRYISVLDKDTTSDDSFQSIQGGT